MKKTVKKTLPNRFWQVDFTCRALVAGSFILVVLLLGSCNELKAWRDGQIKTSHGLVSAGLVNPPAQPINIPQKIIKQLPWDPGFVVLTFSEGRGDVAITALSPGDTLTTTKAMLGKLSALGYETSDNASRILEGVEYTSAQGVYGRLFIKVTTNSHEQCVVELQAYEVEVAGRPSR